jgi:hypothetical protein
MPAGACLFFGQAPRPRDAGLASGSAASELGAGKADVSSGNSSVFQAAHVWHRFTASLAREMQ